MRESIIVVSSALVVCSSLFAVAACSSSSGDGGPKTAEDAGTTDAAVGTTFTAYVAEPIVPGTPATTWRAVAGASAFMDTATGTRIEATSDASGRVVFEGVDFAAGPATLTAYASGRTIVSFVGVTPETVAKQPSTASTFPQAGKDLVIVIEPIKPAAPEGVLLSGTITGKLDDGNTITLGSMNGLGVHQNSAANYTLSVRKDAPLTLVALEWSGGAANGGWDETKHRWLTFDVGAKSADATVALDLAAGTPVVPTKVSVTLVSPQEMDPSSPPGWQVFTREPGPFLGSRSQVTSTDQRSFKADGEYIAAPGDAPVGTSYYFPGSNGASAFVQHSGFPEDGSTVTALSSPKRPASASLGGTVDLATLDPSAEVAGIEIRRNTSMSDDSLLWVVVTLKGSPVPASITLPDLPDAARATLPATAKGRVVAVGGVFDPELPAIVGKGAFSAFFDVKK